ncbi:MAG: peptide deformylase [Defluviitaleaceae bacterium]|nr:peptide deformylase [Defluviitaleaceae bacterium]
MAIRSITNWSDPLFRKTSKSITKFDERLWTLLDDMRDTLERVRGYGCAAVHVGVLKRAVVVLESDGTTELTIELINPEITQTSPETQDVLEGSIAPDSPQGYVVRPKEVTVSALDRQGKPILLTAEGFLAATFCHEIDHLNGILFTDIARPNEKKP